MIDFKQQNHKRFLPVVLDRMQRVLSLLPDGTTKLDLTPSQRVLVAALAAGLDQDDISSLFGISKTTISPTMQKAKYRTNLNHQQMIYCFGFQEGLRYANQSTVGE